MWRPARPAIWPIFLGPQGPHAHAVEFLQRGERHMIDIHVEAHADRIGGDEEIDFAGLVERDLRVAGARA